MISVYWGYLTAILGTGMLSFLLAYLLEGLFDIEFDGRKNPPREIMACLGGFAGLAGYFFLLCCLGSDIRHWEDWSVTPHQFLAMGLGFPFMLVGGAVGGLTGLWGIGKMLGKAGGALKRIGVGLRNIGVGLRNSRAAQEAAKAVTEAQVGQQQVSEREQMRKAFADVQDLCASLRRMLCEGEAFQSLGTISAELEKVRCAMEEDGNKQSAVHLLLTDYLVPTEQGLRLYERLLKRSVSSAAPVLKEMQEKTLPLMHQKILALYDQIHVGDIAQLSTLSSAFEVARTLDVKLEAEAEARL